MSERIWTIVLQSSVLLGSAGLIAWLLQRHGAALRHSVWTLALVFVLLLPLWPEMIEVAPIAVAVGPTRIFVTANGGGVSRSFDWASALEMIWLAGVVLLLMRVVVGQVRGELLRRRGIAWREECFLSPDLSVPVVCGLWSPRVLLPLEAEGWPVGRLAAVLAHERMHVLRRDLWWQLVAQVTCAFYWPNPLVWLAGRAQQRECEQACDDGVVSSGVVATDYADHLVAIARNLQTRNQLEGGLSMANHSTLEQRLKALLNPLTSHRPVSRGTLALTAVLSLALLAPVAGLKLIAQTAGGVKGVVRDASGSNVAGAKVSLRFLKPGMTQRLEMVRTNAEGGFSFPDMPEDFYSIFVEKEGFAVLANTMIKLGGAQSGPLVFTLNLGGMKETVMVNGGILPPPPPPPPPPGQAIAVSPTRVRIGGNVQAAKLINKVTPIYPADCKAERVEGIVMLNAVIGKEGEVLTLEPVNQFVDKRLRESAVSAVKLWRYQPTLLNGNPVEVTTQIEVNFMLMR